MTVETINPNGYGTLIGVDPEVLAEIGKEALPFVEDPNAVLRRKLGLEGSSSTSKSNEPKAGSPTGTRRARLPKSTRSSRKRKGETPPRAPKGSLTPEPEFEAPILRAVEQGGGELPVREVLASVGEQMEGTLNEHDRFEDEHGVARWEKRVPFVRLRLVERGLLDNDAPRGMWRITDAGRETLTKRRLEMTS
jgi:hypothetical protein